MTETVEAPVPIEGLRLRDQDVQNYRALAECLSGKNANYPSAAVTLLESLRMREGWARREKQSDPQLAAQYNQEARELQQLLVDYVYKGGNSGFPIANFSSHFFFVF